MEDRQPQPLDGVPEPIDVEQTDTPALERVRWADLARAGEPASARAGRSPAAAWIAAATSELEAAPGTVATLCRVRLFDVQGAPLLLADADLDAVCRKVAQAHQLDGGVTITSEGDLLALLPGVASWSGLLTTIEAARGVSDRPLASRARIGLTEIASDGPAFALAIEFTLRALQRAIASGAPAAEWSEEDERCRAREHAIVTELVASLERGSGFRLVFQPKFDPHTRAVVGAEGLLRHEGGPFGVVGPAEFLPIAERAGILEELERWVIDEGTAAISLWTDEYGLEFPISLNVRGVDAVRDGFVEHLSGVLARSGVEPSLLRLEISEDDVRALKHQIVPVLHQLRALGVTVALDDFGRSSTSIAELRNLPIDVLKVHRSFIADMASDANAAALVKGVLSLASAFGIETVAAGVETEDQLAMLRDLGCSAVQGFLLAQPLEFGDFGRLLASCRREAA